MGHLYLSTSAIALKRLPTLIHGAFQAFHTLNKLWISVNNQWITKLLCTQKHCPYQILPMICPMTA
jgi:hypothetical protein